MGLEDHAQGMGADCWKIISTMGAAIVGLCGGIVYCAKGWLEAVLARVVDRNDTIAQLNAAKTAAKSKGGSP